VAKIIVIVEKIKDWTSYYPAEKLMTAKDYLIEWEGLADQEDPNQESKEKVKIINLCRNYKYLSNGYYCSLLAEARGHSVIPSIKVINDLSRQFLYNLETDDLDKIVQKELKNKIQDDPFSIKLFFGKTDNELFSDIGRQIFEIFPAPVLHVEFEFNQKWEISSLRAGSIHQLANEDEDKFAAALDAYSTKIWRKPKARKKYRYDMAILHNPLDPMPPSDKKALDNFIKAGKDNDVLVELIEKKDYSRVAEFDALFIRETTAINHHTYRFAKKAQSEGLVVVDDPVSILRCTNKIYMHHLMQANNINSPKTIIISRDQDEKVQELAQKLDFPLIIKIPDGSFSKGVYKVESKEKFLTLTDDLFKKSALLLIQEYFYTDYDWRIGVFNNKCIFACKYYMSKGHWQIYNHNNPTKKGVENGSFETLPLSKVPKHVMSTALKMSAQIGDSLYGVDLKERNGKAYVIEVNDNPNIDSEVEDDILGMELYQHIIHEFVRRIEEKR
jgi:glutathione synthase/RimK-type ligase-like ATP-grasp enzyme